MTDLKDVKKPQGTRPKKSFWGRLKRFFSKRVVIIVIVLIVLLAAGIGVGMLISNALNKNTGNSGSTDFDIGETQSVEDINTLLATGDTEGVAKKVESDLSLANSIDGQLVLAAADVNAGKLDEALKIYLDASEKYGWRADVADQVAFIYEGKGDKAQALTYYEKEKSLLDTNDPTYESQLQVVEESIKRVQ